jgi:hypothetical protein
VVYINECIDVNTALKKFLQTYELFLLDPTVSEEFPMVASPRLYLVIFFQIYGIEPSSPSASVPLIWLINIYSDSAIPKRKEP